MSVEIKIDLRLQSHTAGTAARLRREYDRRQSLIVQCRIWPVRPSQLLNKRGNFILRNKRDGETPPTCTYSTEASLHLHTL
jgi:hypothetical protein